METRRVLETYDWPENTQELESAIGQACVLSSGSELQIDHLPQNILAFCLTKDAARRRESDPPGRPKKQDSGEEVVTIATMEKRSILMALRQTKGDKRKAADLLGIGKTTLYRKLKEYSVQLPSESSISLPLPADSPPATSVSEAVSDSSVRNDGSVALSRRVVA
jgi:two-component system response regulator HydG